MIDTPEEAYWEGYALLCSSVDGDVTSIPSTEEWHLDSLEGVYPGGELCKFEVEAGKHANTAYYVYHTDKRLPSHDTIGPKLRRHYIRGMMESRPVFCWDLESIDLDFPQDQACYIIEHMPYLKAECLNNGRIRLYTCTARETRRALEYIYNDATVARPSRRSLYDNMHQKQ